jgi:hypothetical protein
MGTEPHSPDDAQPQADRRSDAGGLARSAPPEALCASGNPDLFDAAGTIVCDVACRRCAYNLRGLGREGRCPECGTPVGVSTHGDLLRYADPAWVQRLNRGGNLVVTWLIVLILSVIVALCAGIPLLSLIAQRGTYNATVAFAAFAIVRLWFVAVNGAICYGVWLVTSPDPSRIGEDIYAASRKFVRVAVLVGPVWLVVNWLTDMRVFPPPTHAVLEFVNLIAALVIGLGFLAYLRYLKKLTLRIPDAALSARAGTLFRAFVVLVVLTVATLAVALVAALTTATGTTAAASASGPAAGTTSPGITVTAPGTAGPMPVPSGIAPIIAVGGCALAIYGLVVFALYVRWQAKLGKAFDEQVRIARTTWAAGGGPPATN